MWIWKALHVKSGVRWFFASEGAWSKAPEFFPHILIPLYIPLRSALQNCLFSVSGYSCTPSPPSPAPNMPTTPLPNQSPELSIPPLPSDAKVKTEQKYLDLYLAPVWSPCCHHKTNCLIAPRIQFSLILAPLLVVESKPVQL